LLVETLGLDSQPLPITWCIVWIHARTV
jgi:hypothetical protein